MTSSPLPCTVFAFRRRFRRQVLALLLVLAGLPLAHGAISAAWPAIAMLAAAAVVGFSWWRIRRPGGLR